MLTDTRIIHRHGRYAVLAQRQETLLRDGTLLELHPVQEDGIESTFLRALLMKGVGCFIVDVRKLVSDLDHELRVAPTRDRPGTLAHFLRQAFPSGLQFHRRMGESYTAAIVFLQGGSEDFLQPKAAGQRFWPAQVTA